MARVRRFRAIVLATLVLDGLLIAFVAMAYALRPQLLIDIRYSFFAHSVSDVESFRQSPDQMIAAGFLTDSDATRSEWRARLEREIPEFAAMPAGFDSWPNVKKARHLAALFSRDGCEETFSQTTTLLEKLKRIREPYGLCSDHVEVFLALCSIHGVPATEVSITNHTVARVWSRSQQQWVFLDPQYCLMARGEDGRYLTIYQMRELYYRNAPIEFDFFGTSTQRFASDDPRRCIYYDRREDFAEMVLTLGNNVLELDKLRRDLLWLPKPLRQIFYYAAGVMPGYQMLLDDRSTYSMKIERLRAVTYTVGTILLVLNAALPILFIAYRLRGRRLRRQTAPDRIPPALTPQV